jgi:hypothetical protein
VDGLPIEVRRKIMEAQLAHDLQQMGWKQQAGEYERRQMEWRADSWIEQAAHVAVALVIVALTVWAVLS